MKCSTERILTTHTGSLPRPGKLLEMVASGDMKRLQNDPTFREQVRSAVSEMVRLQTATGIDVINDGEQSKSNYGIYIKERLTGFGGIGKPMSFGPRSLSRILRTRLSQRDARSDGRVQRPGVIYWSGPA